MNHPKTRFVAGFIGESNIFDARCNQSGRDTVTVGTEVGKAQASALPVNWQQELPFRYRFVRKICCIREMRVEGFHIKGVVKEHIYVGNLIKTIVFT